MTPPRGAEGRRDLIFDTLQASPGASFRAIVRETGIPAGTARHHLSVLIRRRRIWYTRIGGRLAHFIGERPAHGMGVIRAVTATFDPLDGRLYMAARDQGPLCQKDLVAVIPDDVPRSTVQHRIKRLVRLGILRETPMGRRCMYAVRWTD